MLVRLCVANNGTIHEMLKCAWKIVDSFLQLDRKFSLAWLSPLFSLPWWWWRYLRYAESRLIWGEKLAECDTSEWMDGKIANFHSFLWLFMRVEIFWNFFSSSSCAICCAMIQKIYRKWWWKEENFLRARKVLSFPPFSCWCWFFGSKQASKYPWQLSTFNSLTQFSSLS